VDVSETHVEVGLFDCALGTLGTVRHPLVGTRLDPDEVAGLVRTGIAEVLEGGNPDAVFGVGIGVPGAVRDGGIVHAPTLGWQGVDFAELIHPQAATVVHQQLDLLATAVFRWSGQAWPQVPMDWSIQQEEGRAH